MPILQINFKLNVSSAEYRKIADSVARTIADAPGLVWKVWLLNEQEGEAGVFISFRTDIRLPPISPARLSARSRVSTSCAKSARSGSRRYRS